MRPQIRRGRQEAHVARRARRDRRCGWRAARARARSPATRARAPVATSPRAPRRLAVRRRVADRGVAGQRLRVVDRALVGATGERTLDTAVLVAERDLQVQHPLAVALEAEMARLDHAGVHGPDRDLVDLVAFDAEEVGDADRRGGTAARRGLEPHRLEPRVASVTRTPHCSASSRSKMWTCGVVATREGQVSPAVARAASSTPARSSARIATSSSAPPSCGDPNSEQTRWPASTPVTIAVRNASSSSRGTASSGIARAARELDRCGHRAPSR